MIIGRRCRYDRRTMKLPALVLALAIAAPAFLSTGCVVRTGKSHHAVHGHPDKHRHDHCHQRGGKHKKRMCHSHPHGGGHH